VRDGQRYLADPASGQTDAVSLAELGLEPATETLKALLIEAFQERLGVRLQPSTLTEAERALMAELEKTKYRNPEWNLGKP